MKRSKIYINKNDKQLYEKGITFCDLDIVISNYIPEKFAIIINDSPNSDTFIIKWKNEKQFLYRKVKNFLKYD